MFIIIAALACASCVPVVVGGDSGYNVAYVAGELQAREDITIDEAWTGTQSALEELGLTIIDRQKDGLKALLKAYGSESRQVTVRMENAGERSTIFKIRVGTFGERSESFVILDKIEEQLGLRYSGRMERV